ncbi:MAG: M24 family metallopeptidase [Proteobacteria bacterium]|nr:MAG: M24 family metallopeptidase [Pseudomonadota bacterium]
MSPNEEAKNEIDRKISIVRKILKANNLSAVRLRGVDWFAWATAGASNVVLLTTDVGIAEVIISADEAFVLTDSIEAERLEEEEIKGSYPIWKAAWQEPQQREAFVRELTHAGTVASDMPRDQELPLPKELREAKCILQPGEVDRYRTLCQEAAMAMTETLKDACQSWTGFELAARGSAALWSRGIHPALTLVGDERRLPLYRHATASADTLGDRAMLVFCARRHGLFANLTRFIYFRDPTARELRMKHDLAAIEAEIFDASRPGVSLGQIYETMRTSYAKFGYPGEIDKHHQGGTCGYLSREEVARPASENRIQAGMALAWNPSLIGCKIEDTVLVTDKGLEILTIDPAWPTFYAEDRMRPDYLVRT